MKKKLFTTLSVLVLILVGFFLFNRDEEYLPEVQRMSAGEQASPEELSNYFKLSSGLLLEDESQQINTLNQIYATKKWPNSNKFSDFSNYHFSKMINTHHLWLENTQLLLEPTKSIQLNNALSFYLNIVTQKTSLFTKMFALNSLKSISKVSFLKNVENTEALKNLPNFEDFYRLALEGEFLALKELIELFSKKEIEGKMENPFQLNFSNMFLRPFFLSKTTINWLYKIYLIDYLAHPDCEGEDCSPTYKKLTQIGPQWFINPVGRQTLTNVYIYPGAIRKKMEAALKIIRPL